MLLTIPNTFVASTQAKSAEVNANFAAVATAFNTTAVQTDVAKTITVSHTQAADLLFSDALYDIGKTGATRPRDGFFSRNLTVGGSLNVSSTINLSGAASTPQIRAALDAYSVANGTSISFAGSGGLVQVYDSNTGNVGIVAVAGGAGVVLAGANFSGVVGNPGTYNVYSTGGNIFIQNNRGILASFSLIITRVA